MESDHEVKKQKRTEKLTTWLVNTCGFSSVFLLAMPGDASFRRYYRIRQGGESFVVMDAEPPLENCRPFVAIAGALSAVGLKPPAILAQNLDDGFLLLSDFGEMTYLKALNDQTADKLYGAALEVLACLQGCDAKPYWPIPSFTDERMRQEWVGYKEWFLTTWLNLSYQPLEKALDDCFEQLILSAGSQPQVFMHRDYHSANLMCLPTGEVGILDFQDAFIGPVTYDLVSLLRDCYIHWPDERVRHWALSYWLKLKMLNVTTVNQQVFLRWFDLMSVERHLKALFTFARKHSRDKQSHYLNHVPRTLNYLVNVSRAYPELGVLHRFLESTVQPKVEEMMLCAHSF